MVQATCQIKKRRILIIISIQQKGGITILKINKALAFISVFLVLLFAVSAISAADNASEVAVIADEDNSVDVLSAEDNVEIKNVVEDDADELGVADESEKVSFGSGNRTFSFGGNGTKFDFSNISITTSNGTKFDLSSLTNGTFTLGNGTSFNFSSLGNGTISFGNGSSLNLSSIFNSTGNGTFDLSSILNMFGGSKLTANTTDIEQIYSGDTIFKATILQSNKTVESGKDVIFTINNENYIERTDENGTATLKIDLKAGEYYIFTEYNNEILAKNLITIKKAKSAITAKTKTYKVKTKTKKYAITLKSKSGKAIKKAKVTLKIKGKTYKATTNNKGKATFKITKLTKTGKFSGKVKFAGNGYYKASSKSVTIKVKK